MKHLFTVLGIAGLLVVALTVTNVAAQSSQPGAPSVVTMTPMPQGQVGPGTSAQGGWGMGMGRGMMGGGMMSGRRGGRGGATGSTPMNAGPGMMQGQGQTGAKSGGGYGMGFETMMAGVTPMYEDVAQYFGMTSQDLYNHMAAGKSMAQIATEKGFTEQQLMDAIMMGRQTAYSQGVRGGYMTQAQADTMYQSMNHDNLSMMVNGQGTGSAGWSMMWGSQSTGQGNR